jgi:ubiquinone biosynthesis protein
MLESGGSPLLRRAGLREAARVPTPLIPERERRAVPLVAPRPRALGSRTALRLRFASWMLRFWWQTSVRRRSPSVDLAVELSALLQDAGGGAVKVGQLLSLRPDVFSPDFCQVLAGLQFRAVGFPPALARSILETETGRSVDDLFDVFEDAPIAAASIAQVHRAHLRRENVWVAVKIQRPHVAKDFEKDLEVARRWLGRIKRLKRLAHFSWDEMLWELEEVVREEVDYRYEAANMRRMKKTLRAHKVHVPRVYDYSTSRVLVMEYVPGVLMSDILEVGRRDPARLNQWLEENEVDLEEVGRRLYFTFQRQVHEDNLFHGDLHPGNIIVLRRGRLALIDLGSVGTLDPETVDKLRLYYQAIADQDFAAAADYTLLFVGRLPRMDPEAFRPAVARVFLGWLRRNRVRELSYKEKAFSEAGIEVSRLIAKYKVLISWQFMRVNRANVTLEASLRFLQPQADQAQLIREFMRDQALRRQKAGQTLAGFLSSVRHDVEFAAELQEQILRNQGRALEASASLASRVLASAFGTLAVAGLAATAFGLLTYFRWLPAPVIDALYDFSLPLTAAGLVAFSTMRSLRGYFVLPEIRP